MASRNITFESLRDRAFNALEDSASPHVGHKTFQLLFVSAMSLIQIAQELNEIKHALNRIALPNAEPRQPDAGQESISGRERDKFFVSPLREGRSAEEVRRIWQQGVPS